VERIDDLFSCYEVALPARFMGGLHRGAGSRNRIGFARHGGGSEQPDDLWQREGFVGIDPCVDNGGGNVATLETDKEVDVGVIEVPEVARAVPRQCAARFSTDLDQLPRHPVARRIECPCRDDLDRQVRDEASQVHLRIGASASVPGASEEDREHVSKATVPGVLPITVRVLARTYRAGTMRPIFSLLFLLASLTACSHRVDLTHQSPATFAEEPGGAEQARVRRVVDGDTIVVEVTGRTEGPGAGRASVGDEHRVRLIGIDTPESVKPNSPVECFGKEASAAATALLEGEDVQLVKDVEERDSYDRLLRYVYIGSEMANARLVANGYATSYTYPPNVRWSELFVRLEREAREGDRGLWSPSTCAGDA
jgi:micrococcal nuclease